MLPLLPICALLLASPVEDTLARAQAAYDAGRFSEVTPLAEAALEQGEQPSERARAWVLLAKVQAAFNAPNEAVALFTKALRENASFELETRESPKVRALFEQARTRVRSEASGEEAVAPDALPSPRAGLRVEPPGTAEGPLYKRWWIWAGVGVLAAGAATAVWATTPNFPEGTLGKRELR